MIVLADANGRCDTPAYNFLLQIECPIPFVLVSRVSDYKFNEQLLSLDKYILVCYTEYNWNWDQENIHIWGENTEKFSDIFPGNEWRKFDEFVRKKVPLLIFKREYHSKDKRENMLPVEYPNWQPKYQAQTKNQFEARRLEVFNFWGFSHPARKQFQGDAYLHSLKGDITIIDNIFYYQNYLQENHKRYWGSMHIPHFARLPINQILEINGNAKLSLSLPGAGWKCFRSTGESPVNSVMCLWYDDLIWTYSWHHNINCIRLSPGKEIEGMEEALQDNNLYNIYLSGIENADRYRVPRYISEYIIPIIKSL